MYWALSVIVVGLLPYLLMVSRCLFPPLPALCILDWRCSLGYGAGQLVWGVWCETQRVPGMICRALESPRSHRRYKAPMFCSSFPSVSSETLSTSWLQNILLKNPIKSKPPRAKNDAHGCVPSLSCCWGMCGSAVSWLLPRKEVFLSAVIATRKYCFDGDQIKN